MTVSFCAVFFPQDVSDEILNLIESVSEGFPTYSYIHISVFFSTYSYIHMSSWFIVNLLVYCRIL